MILEVPPIPKLVTPIIEIKRFTIVYILYIQQSGELDGYCLVLTEQKLRSQEPIHSPNN